MKTYIYPGFPDPQWLPLEPSHTSAAIDLLSFGFGAFSEVDDLDLARDSISVVEVEVEALFWCVGNDDNIHSWPTKETSRPESRICFG